VPARVATIVTRLEGGAGGLVVAGVRATPEVEHTILAGSAGRLLEEATAAGAEVVLAPWLRADLAPVADLRARARLVRWLEGERFPVVHTHCAKAGALGRLAAARAGVPRVVHTYHGFPFHELQSPARRAAYVAIERRLGRLTDVALCVGRAVAAEAVRRRLVAPTATATIGVCVDGPEVAAAALSARDRGRRARARRLLGVPDDAAVVGAVGRCTYQKAPEDLLRAAARLDRTGLVVVWIGGGELEQRLARMAGRMPAGTRVILAGERHDVLDLLPGLDVLALPSRYEGLPTAVVEAMVCGVPVVATAVNAVGDLVVPGRTGLLVPPGRPDALAGAVGWLLDHPEPARAMASRAHAALGDRFATGPLRAALLEAWGMGAAPGIVALRSDGAPGGGPAALWPRTVRGLGT
jgi:glycosyltransferase involved in cell wall biosynthesis